MNKKQAVYTREQLVKAERYKEQRDLLEALLEEGKSYSLRETDAVLQKYREGKVRSC